MEKGTNNGMMRLFLRLQRVNEQRHLYSIRTAFITTMPAMIVGAFAVAINNMPIPAYQDFMAGLFGGDAWRNFGQLCFNGTTQLVALVVLFNICGNLTGWYNSRRQNQAHAGIAGILGVACYFILTLPVEGADSIPFSTVGATGLFVAMAVAILSTECYVRLIGRGKRGHILSDDPNVSVPQAFASVMPTILIVAVVACCAWALRPSASPKG